jgi:hypothetical protein
MKFFMIPSLIALFLCITPCKADYSAWSYSMQVRLNTTPSGADVNGTVENFPLLVRLVSTDFDFSQAKSNGEDIRFTDHTGNPAPYHIERWTDGAAEIWVKASTVPGNSDEGYLIMHWGNSSASDISCTECVFEASNSFSGVWHLGNEGGTAQQDATINSKDGIPSGVQAMSL